MDNAIQDIWFRTALPLKEIAKRLELRDLIVDAENHWEWVIGTLGDVRLDITRTHRRRPKEVDTRIFILAHGQETETFTADLVTQLVDRLLEFSLGPVSCGRWEYITGNQFNLVVVHEFRKPDDASPK